MLVHYWKQNKALRNTWSIVGNTLCGFKWRHFENEQNRSWGNDKFDDGISKRRIQNNRGNGSRSLSYIKCEKVSCNELW